MYLHTNLRYLKPLKVTDAGRGGEFYFTYQVYSEAAATLSALTQGFSIGCSIDDGVTARVGEQVEVNDPKFTIELAEVDEGKTRHVVLDLFAWESNHSTVDVKKIFTNQAAEKLLTLDAQTRENKKKLEDEFFKWLDDSGTGILSDFVALTGGSVALPYVELAKKVLPLVRWAIEVVKSRSDRYLGCSRRELFYARESGKLKYRWLLDNGVETWILNETQPYFAPHTFRQDNGDNILAVQVIHQPLYALGDVPK